jgi:hypothetical protein
MPEAEATFMGQLEIVRMKGWLYSVLLHDDGMER